MQVIDFKKLLKASGIHSVAHDAEDYALRELEDVYQGDGGTRVRSTDRGRSSSMEMVQLTDRAFLFASDGGAKDEDVQQQSFTHSDWLHIQFRVSGGGREHISQSKLLETPEHSCIVARYPQDSVIDRTSYFTSHWTAACLLFSPKALTELLETPATRLPESMSWMAVEEPRELCSRQLPLQARFMPVINDILSCQYQGALRRTFMRAKSLELLTMVLHAVNSSDASSGAGHVRLSANDREKLERSHQLMIQNLESSLTLEQLARRVGLNRTKLATGFKQLYGVPVQNFWRDAKLNHARDLLKNDGARVTEVAASLGYTELSSFTRAFSRKFGSPPREWRS